MILPTYKLVYYPDEGLYQLFRDRCPSTVDKDPFKCFKSVFSYKNYVNFFKEVIIIEKNCGLQEFKDKVYEELL